MQQRDADTATHQMIILFFFFGVGQQNPAPNKILKDTFLLIIQKSVVFLF